MLYVSHHGFGYQEAIRSIKVVFCTAVKVQKTHRGSGVTSTTTHLLDKKVSHSYVISFLALHFYHFIFAISFLSECDQLRELKRLPITRDASQAIERFTNY